MLLVVQILNGFDYMWALLILNHQDVWTRLEMQNCSPKASTELLLFASYFDLKDLFSKFNIYELLRLTELYTKDCLVTERMMLKDQLTTFISDMQHDEDFVDPTLNKILITRSL